MEEKKLHPTELHPKVKAAAQFSVGGALASWIVAQYGVPVPPEAAIAVNAIVALIAAYLKPSN